MIVVQAVLLKVALENRPGGGGGGKRGEEGWRGGFWRWRAERL